MRLDSSAASPGNLSQLFSIVQEVAVEVFSDPDKSMTLTSSRVKRTDVIATGIWVAPRPDLIQPNPTQPYSLMHRSFSV